VLTNLASNSNSNTPRRVQFRPGKDTDDSNIIKGPTRGRITRKSGTGASDISKDSGASQAEVVVLRHQAANEKKKSEQQSFNKVIKKMASRLAEARKSKVKALVGAFETVISLQEKRGRSSSVSIS
jgi:pyruvate carboxylase